jgi:hypothetical protein
MEHKELILDLYRKNTKIKDIPTLIKTSNYLIKSNYNDTTIIKYGKKHFKLRNINLKSLKTLKVRPETIFKIDIYRIKKTLLELFNNIVIQVVYEETSQIQKELHKQKNYYKHDAILIMSNGNKTYEIGIEYNEQKSHNNTRQINNDNSREINSLMFLDLFFTYNESENNYEFFMNDLCYYLIIIGCTLKNDKYLLAKLLYLRNNNNVTKICEDDFVMFLQWKQSNNIKLEELYDSIKPKNDNNEEYSCEEYIEHLQDDFDLEIINDKCDYNTLTIILNSENNDCSQKLCDYRKMIITVANKLTDASDIIMDLMTKINKKTNSLITFLHENIKNLHLLKNENLVELGIGNFNKHK